MAEVEHLSALVLERFSVPVLAVAEDGTILFANRAFADILGRTPDEVTALTFGQILPTMPVDESAVSVIRAHAGLIVELLHQTPRSSGTG